MAHRSNEMKRKKKKIPLQILSLIHKIKSVSKVIKAFRSTTKIPFVTSFPYKQPPPPPSSEGDAERRRTRDGEKWDF